MFSIWAFVLRSDIRNRAMSPPPPRRRDSIWMMSSEVIMRCVYGLNKIPVSLLTDGENGRDAGDKSEVNHTEHFSGLLAGCGVDEEVFEEDFRGGCGDFAVDGFVVSLDADWSILDGSRAADHHGL